MLITLGLILEARSMLHVMVAFEQATPEVEGKLWVTAAEASNEVVLEGADGTFGSTRWSPGQVAMQCHGIEEVANALGALCCRANGF
jgi:hypothetical protein